MRSEKKDIVEIYGFAPDDLSPEANNFWDSQTCPFVGSICTKEITRKGALAANGSTNTAVCGVCSVSYGIKTEPSTHIIVCPKRMYVEEYRFIRSLAYKTWNDEIEVLIGGTLEDLKEKALLFNEVVIAFGTGSGREIQITASAGTMSMDWVLQRYLKDEDGNLVPKDFIGIEVQSIDTTGSYALTWQSYEKLKSKQTPSKIEPSGHGLNWANVHKRLIPQLIRKGNIYKELDECLGVFFLVPETVYKKFEEVLGEVENREDGPSRERLSVLTVKLGSLVSAGNQREVEEVRYLHYDLADIVSAFVNRTDTTGAKALRKKLQNILL